MSEKRSDGNKNKKTKGKEISITLKVKDVILIAAVAAAVVFFLLWLAPQLGGDGKKPAGDDAAIGEEPSDEASAAPTVLDFSAEDMDVSAVDIKGKKIIVDAGHGGDDPGSLVASSGKPEKEINLEIAQKLKAILAAGGAEVIMTRETDAALAPTKEEDFVAREKIIAESNADMFVSIHQNEYETGEASGPQTFFVAQGSVGKRLAVAIMDMINYELDIQQPRIALPAAYRILKTGSQPSCTVECGFLSNPEEGEKLQTDEYQQTMAQAIADGIKLYVKRFG
jgi:N-acetylmuramoyl-L-alanine amidase